MCVHGALQGNGISFKMYSYLVHSGLHIHCGPDHDKVLNEYDFFFQISSYYFPFLVLCTLLFSLMYSPFYFSKDTNIFAYLSEHICGINYPMMGRYSKSILLVCMPLGSLQITIIGSEWFYSHLVNGKLMYSIQYQSKVRHSCLYRN